MEVNDATLMDFIVQDAGPKIKLHNIAREYAKHLTSGLLDQTIDHIVKPNYTRIINTRA